MNGTPLKGGHRPHRFVLKRKPKRVKPVGVDELARRYEQGQDLWTGQQLQGRDASEWLRNVFEMSTDGDEDILSVEQLLVEAELTRRNRLESLGLIGSVV